MLGVAPQLRDVDRHAVKQGIKLGPVGAQARQRVAERPEAATLQERAQTALHLWALVLGQVDAGELAQSVAEPLVVVSGGDAHQPASDLIASASSIEGEHVVGELGLDDRPRHSVYGAARLRLGKDAAAAALDLGCADEPVVAHPGEHDEQRPAAPDARRRP